MSASYSPNGAIQPELLTKTSDQATHEFCLGSDGRFQQQIGTVDHKSIRTENSGAAAHLPAVGGITLRGNAGQYDWNVFKNNDSVPSVAVDDLTGFGNDNFLVNSAYQPTSENAITPGHNVSHAAASTSEVGFPTGLIDTIASPILDFTFCPHPNCSEALTSLDDYESHLREHFAPVPSLNTLQVGERTSPNWFGNGFQDAGSNCPGPLAYPNGTGSFDLDFSLDFSASDFQAIADGGFPNFDGALTQDGALAVEPATLLATSQHTGPPAANETERQSARMEIQRAPRPQQAATTTRHRCTHPGCGKEYKRHGDMERHRIDKHAQKGFPCNFPSCDRKGVRAYGRKDKLVAHLRQGHNFKI